jgi:transposase
MKIKQHTSARKRNLDHKVQNSIDFSNKQLYVGIDVHKLRWQVAVYHEGLILGNTSIEGSAEALITHLRRFYGDARFCCVYESGPFGFSLCRSLWAAGMECMVVNPADIPSADKERRSKIDQVDARKLSMHLAAGAAMLGHYKALTKRMKGQEAIIRITRKLLRRIRAVMLSGRIYVSGIDGALTSKDIGAPLPASPKKRGRPKKGINAAEVSA